MDTLIHYQLMVHERKIDRKVVVNSQIKNKGVELTWICEAVRESKSTHT